MKFGICTGGGDCPGLNAVIRAVVKYCVREQIEIIGIRDSLVGLMDENLKSVKSLHYSDVKNILKMGGTILGTYNKGNPFKSAATKQQSLDEVVKGYKKLGLDALIVVGGDGTQGVAAELVQMGLNIVGIPKTIDNDLMGTDQTIGFATAVDLVAESVCRLRSTAESHDRLMILEVMGRDSGYIALHGGIAGGANIVLIPEIPYSYEKIVEKLNQRKKLGRNFSVIVIAEGAFPAGQNPNDSQKKDRQSHADVGKTLIDELKKYCDIDSRLTVLGHLQRGGEPSSYDKILATQMGVYAVKLAINKDFGKFVCLSQGKISSVNYAEIPMKKRRIISLDDQMIETAENIGICLGR